VGALPFWSHPVGVGQPQDPSHPSPRRLAGQTAPTPAPAGRRWRRSSAGSRWRAASARRRPGRAGIWRSSGIVGPCREEPPRSSFGYGGALPPLRRPLIVSPPPFRSVVGRPAARATICVILLQRQRLPSRPWAAPRLRRLRDAPRRAGWLSSPCRWCETALQPMAVVNPPPSCASARGRTPVVVTRTPSSSTATWCKLLRICRSPDGAGAATGW